MTYPEIVTGRDRIIESDGDPLVRRVLWRKEQLAALFRDATDATRQIIVRARRRGYQGSQDEDCGEQHARNIAVQHSV